MTRFSDLGQDKRGRSLYVVQSFDSYDCALSFLSVQVNMVLYA